MNKIEQINEYLQTKGYDLRQIKGCDISDTQKVIKALTKQEAIEALKFYRQIKVPVLGGDVFYLNRRGKINWTYDNWYYIRKKEETDVEYLERSINETIDYINKYKNDSFRNCIFLFDIVYDRKLFLE
jgi:hypothetical protein